jgi:hypothetical protein
MNRTDFDAALRAELRKVPVTTRQTWDGTALLGWWMETSKENPGLVWDGCEGDLWQTVHGYCLRHDLIGPRAY